MTLDVRWHVEGQSLKLIDHLFELLSCAPAPDFELVSQLVQILDEEKVTRDDFSLSENFLASLDHSEV